MSEPGIVVVGGGFAGFWAAVAARRVLRASGAPGAAGAPVTLVSRGPIMELRPRLYEAAPETLGVDVRPLLDLIDVSFVVGEATGLDPEAREVAVAGGAALPYERLVVATGSVMPRPPVPGADAAWSVDTQAEAVAFDQRLATIATTVDDPVLAVVGAGFTGIELVLELRDRLAVHGGDGVAERARLFLVDRAAEVGPELGDGPRPEILLALVEARVELRLGATVTALAADRIDFADGSRVTADAVALATGLRAAPFAAQVPGERDELGRVIVEPTLAAPGAPGVFVVGDAAAVDTGTGHRALQSCQHALVMGPHAGENAARSLLGLPLVDYRQERYVTCLDLGRSGAVLTEGWDRTVRLSGAEGKAVKRNINTVRCYPPADPTADELLAASALRT